MTTDDSHCSYLDPRVRRYVNAAAIGWASGDVDLSQARRLLLPNLAQASTVKRELLNLKKTGDESAAILFDFGQETYGGIRITLTHTTANHAPVRFRVRFGESYTEAMSQPNQDHAVHDEIIHCAFLGSTEFGNTAFRFVRIELVDPGATCGVLAVVGVTLLRDLKPSGRFECSDDRLNQIWQTGARTVHLCMQEYLWDGAKRDKLVWIGDMHPETRTISAVFGEQEIVPASLDFARDEFALPMWINGISSYSMWWIIIQHDWYLHYGRRDWLQHQRDYLVGLVGQLVQNIDDSGSEKLIGRRFLDWPTSEDPIAQHAGLQALMVMALEAAAGLCDALAEPAAATTARNGIEQLHRHLPAAPGVKPANALLALSGLCDPRLINEKELAVDPLRGISTFYGFYVLQARALAGDIAGALQVIRTYWGKMLDVGATTFWEDFNLDWTVDAGRIDQPTPAGKKDLHADFGNYCYKGLRHSLCHGWASGPTAWMSEHLLGVTPRAPGFARARVRPNLADLDWLAGSYPTPFGPIDISLKKSASGKVEQKISVPPGIALQD